MPEPPGPEAIDPSLEEVRVAMALNGGVSLAVWMGGCAVELDCARRAHLGPEQLGFDGYEPGETGGTRSRSVYAGLCNAFHRRLSLDVLTGASAGGVNGALLAAAMVSGRRLHPRFVRERWLQLGDLSRLLQNPATKEPQALMQGELFHTELLRAFHAVCGDEQASEGGPDLEQRRALAAGLLPEGQQHGDEGRLLPDLDVTMTDVVGAGRTFPDDWGHELFAREHAPRFKFRKAVDYTAPALAAAARTSASFPLAFEPWKIEGDAATRAGVKDGTYGIDGGLLDNAPIRAALELIPFRPADARVRRYACYLNADPAQAERSDKTKQPGVEDVLGYVVGLPRTAPFVEQLYAVRAATNRPVVTEAIVRELLQMDLGALEETAEALLPAYRRRRTARSIEELLAADPVAARAAREALPAEGTTLPWIPAADQIEAPTPGSWGWGIRPAQRVLYLLLDLLRLALADARDDRQRAAVLERRAAIHANIDRLERIHEIVRAGLGPALAEVVASAGNSDRDPGDVAGVMAGQEGDIYGLVADAATDFKGLREAEIGGGQLPDELIDRLFEQPPGEGEERPRPLDGFFRRVLAIEVVRRALSDETEIETAQRLSFVQLTPTAPTPILSAKPLSDPGPKREAKDKLTGLGLAHFAGFYRRAWRANDFMWGRLDAAARVVDLLLDRPIVDDEGECGRRALAIADAVLGSAPDKTEKWLVQEVLADAPVLSVPPPSEELLGAKRLHTDLRTMICRELTLADSSPSLAELPLTRAVCVRAAQLEVIRDELPVLVEEARADGERGSSGQPLELGDDLLASIGALRSAPTLPQRLIGKGEAVSDLGLGTIAHASRVGISMVESTAAPLTKPLGVMRVPALAIAGVVARGWLHRAAAACGFSAAAIYLSSRIVTAESSEVMFSDVWSLPVLLSLVAALVVIAAIAVPALQASNGIKRVFNAIGATGLALSGGVLAILLALCVKGGDLNLEQALLCPGAENPSDAILGFALVATAGLSALQLPPFGGALTRWLRKPQGGARLSLLMIAVALAVAIPSSIALWGEVDEGWWKAVVVGLALPGAPLVVAWYLKPWKRRGPAS